MEAETTVQPLISIAPAAENNINAKFIVLDKARVCLEGEHKTCLALVADESAAVHFQLWGDAVDAGDILLLTKGIFSYSRNSLVLRAGKRGKVEKVGEFIMPFVETPNLGEIQWGHHPQICPTRYHLHSFPSFCVAALDSHGVHVPCIFH